MQKGRLHGMYLLERGFSAKLGVPLYKQFPLARRERERGRLGGEGCRISSIDRLEASAAPSVCSCPQQN